MMMWYDGLMQGFNQAIYGNAIRVLGGNIQIHAAGYRAKIDSNPLLPLTDDSAAIKAALSNPEVIAATRRIVTGGMVTNREGAFSLEIIGIEPEAEAAIIQSGTDAGKPLSLIAQHIVDGRWLTLDDQDSILIGRGLADVMNVKIGDRITLVGSDIHKQNRQRTMTIVGIYDLGLPINEKGTVYISLGEAQALYGLNGQSTEVQVTLKQLGMEKSVIAAISPTLPGYEVESWEENYPELGTAVNRKDTVMNIFSIIIIMIAGIGILNLLLMAVYERTREIGLLGAMGLKPRQIATSFILEGTMIGVVGALLGVVLGLIINGTLRQVGMDFASFANMTEYMALISPRIYPTLALDRAVWRVITVIAICTLAAWIPAREAARREPAEALHYV
jgi:ABC-type lipoprotein release transport system permease subunit